VSRRRRLGIFASVSDEVYTLNRSNIREALQNCCQLELDGHHWHDLEPPQLIHTPRGPK
jgi:hypothetical protein